MTALGRGTIPDGPHLPGGDAAHRFPPPAVSGSIPECRTRTASWKLAAVERGWCDESLLDSYQRERQPVAAAYSAQSHGNALRMGKLFGFVASAIHPTPGRPRLAERRLSSPELRPAIEELIELQRPHFDSFGLQIGFRYGDGRGRTTSPISCRVVDGVRLPHAWIEIAGRSEQRARSSRSGDLR